jgi:hypothetical protein
MIFQVKILSEATFVIKALSSDWDGIITEFIIEGMKFLS